MQEHKLDDIFQCQYPTEAQLKRYEIIQEAAKQFAKTIRDNTSGTDQQEALRLIRQTIITANTSLVEEYISEPEKVLSDELQFKLRNMILSLQEENLVIENIKLNVYDCQLTFGYPKKLLIGVNSCITFIGINIDITSHIPKGIAHIILKNKEERIIKFY